MPKPPGRLRGRAGQREEVALRRDRALELRLARYSYRAIGQALGVSRTVAHEYVASAIAEVNARRLQNAEAIRAMELETLDAIQRALWPSIVSTTPPDLEAARVVLGIVKLRSELEGISPPPAALVPLGRPPTMLLWGFDPMAVFPEPAKRVVEVEAVTSNGTGDAAAPDS